MLLKETIKSYVREILRENAEREAIKRMVRKQLREMYNEGVFEGGSKKKEDKEEKKDDQKKADNARAQLKTLLKNPAIKKSQVAYNMMPDVDPDSARHILQDKIDGKDPLSASEANDAIDFIHNSGI
jgi:hypothetical protein